MSDADKAKKEKLELDRLIKLYKKMGGLGAGDYSRMLALLLKYYEADRMVLFNE